MAPPRSNGTRRGRFPRPSPCRTPLSWPDHVEFELTEPRTRGRLMLRYRLHPAGALEASAELVNDGSSALDVAAIRLLIPLPERAREMLDFTGSWSGGTAPPAPRPRRRHVAAIQPAGTDGTRRRDAQCRRDARIRPPIGRDLGGPCRVEWNAEVLVNVCRRAPARWRRCWAVENSSRPERSGCFPASATRRHPSTSPGHGAVWTRWHPGCTRSHAPSLPIPSDRARSC